MGSFFNSCSFYSYFTVVGCRVWAVLGRMIYRMNILEHPTNTNWKLVGEFLMDFSAMQTELNRKLPAQLWKPKKEVCAYLLQANMVFATSEPEFGRTIIRDKPAPELLLSDDGNPNPLQTNPHCRFQKQILLSSGYARITSAVAAVGNYCMHYIRMYIHWWTLVWGNLIEVNQIWDLVSGDLLEDLSEMSSETLECIRQRSYTFISLCNGAVTILIKCNNTYCIRVHSILCFYFFRHYLIVYAYYFKLTTNYR